MSDVASILCRVCKATSAPVSELNIRALAGHHQIPKDDQREVLIEVRVCGVCLDKAADELDAWRPWFRKLLREGYTLEQANRIMMKAMQAPAASST